MPDRCRVERGDSLEPELEDVDRLDVADRAETLAGVPPDPPIELVDLFVGQP